MTDQDRRFPFETNTTVFERGMSQESSINNEGDRQGRHLVKKKYLYFALECRNCACLVGLSVYKLAQAKYVMKTE